MSHFQLIRFSDSRALAQAAAADWLKELAKPGARNPFCIALTGGRIARPTYAAFAGLAQAQRRALEQAHFFWGDERCVPPTDQESNFKLAQESLLAPLRIPAEQIHRVRGEAPPEVAAREAETALRRFAPFVDGGQPVLDLVLLGVGENGHIASLFPGEPESAMSSPAVYRPVIGSKPPPQRITLGYPALAAAREVWVLASGAGKAQVLRESLVSDGQTPLARLLKLRNHTRIYTDLPVETAS